MVRLYLLEDKTKVRVYFRDGQKKDVEIRNIEEKHCLRNVLYLSIDGWIGLKFIIVGSYGEGTNP